MAEQSRAQLDVDATGGMGEHVAAQAAQGGFEQHDAEQADGDHVKGAEPPVHQNLVHYHLKEQRGEQREDLQHEGHQQHFAEQLAVLDDGRNEPGEVELRQFASQRSLGADQDQLAAPARLKRFEVQHLGTLALRVMDQRLAIVDARNDEEPSVVVGRDGGQRGMSETLDLAASGLGFQSQLLGSQQKFAPSEGATIFGELMSQLLGGYGNVMETGQHDQTCKTAIDRRRRTYPLVID
ncbi:hypothetical protein D3C78_436560 [compost metagenome]